MVDLKEAALSENVGDAGSEKTNFSSKKGCIDAMLPQVSAEQRDRLHRKISLWLVRRGRPLTLPERDQEFRDIFEEIFKGGYTPPSYKLVVDMILSLSAEGKLKVKNAVADLMSEGILPSIGGDIWSQGGIAIFGVLLVYWLDANFKLHERLVAAIPFSSVRHTAAELESATLESAQHRLSFVGQDGPAVFGCASNLSWCRKGFLQSEQHAL
ncbi:hypothetical protein CYMTET_54704 [Cymbomonas tetramitiformis]|uniref:Uncharacterized protein n=1 Tax=Cymbomonas tetramitiformis TaxID=36881 RepID=A0AAE0ENH0_9CHLO|nr:hypothetical protein CYMTET_54704 [Cymbomonas tetramitiformis]